VGKRVTAFLPTLIWDNGGDYIIKGDESKMKINFVRLAMGDRRFYNIPDNGFG
jgi:hypothetical protein